MKRYIKIRTITLTGGDFAGHNALDGAPAGAQHEGYRALEPGISDRREPVEGLDRALEAARAVFETSGSFPGFRPLSALVRVDGGRAVVCQSRGRRGW